MGVFAMPSLGADMEAGKLVEWMIAPGDTVRRGDVVAVVETQKGAIEIECFQDGTVERLEAELGQTLPVGAPLAVIRGPGEAESAAPAAPSPEPAPAPRKAAAPAKPAAPTTPAEPAPPPEKPAAPPAAAPAPAAARAGEAPPSSPAARALAAERGIDLSTLSGSGPAGAILLADVEAAGGGQPAPAPETAPRKAAAKPGLDLAAMREAIGAAMARSKREIPHYYLTQTMDLQPATDWLAATNADRPPETRLLMGALLVKAVARAAAEVPEMNGHFGPDGFAPSTAVHAGVAVALRGGGLVAPAIRDADGLTLDDLMAAMRDLVARARTGRLRASEMTDGTITVSSLGEGAAEAMAAVIYPPQVAIVGFGAPVIRPWIVDDAVVPRSLVTVTLSADHRASDGRRGAKFLAALNRMLQDPEAL